MNKILVTGGAGFMGSNFIHFLLMRDPHVSVVNLDALTYAGNTENLVGIDEARYRFMEGDITDIALVKNAMSDVDTVVNFAAETHVDRSIHAGSKDFVHTNIQGVHTMLEALRESTHVQNMVHISTDEVWGDVPLDSKAQCTEESPFKPNSPYAASKAAGDLLVRAYVKTYNLPVIVSHSVNNFGPRQFPEKLIPFFTLKAQEGVPLPLYGDGTNVRDWLYVDDHSEAIFTLLEKGTAGEVYNISSGEEHANIDIAKNILQILGKPENQFTFVTDRPAHDVRYSVDSTKLHALGWKPRGVFGEKLKETIQWYLDNSIWVKRLLQRVEKINPHIAA